MNANKLLTIGVPTYNRSYYLDNFFSLLYDVLDEILDVKILVSDNNSQDETEIICKKWIALFDKSNIEIEYIKRDKHVSGVENILSLFKSVNTPYFMFLGDDDALDKEGFRSALNILDQSPSAVIQNLFWGQMRSSEIGFVDPETSFKLFYEYGNAYVAIVSTQYFSSFFENPDLSFELKNNLWPQTVIGYLTILNFDNLKKVYVIDKKIGDCFVDGGTKLTNSDYWVRSLQDLLAASWLIKKYSSKSYAITNFISLNSFGLNFHLQSIIHYSLLQNSVPKIKPILELLNFTRFGFRGIFLRLVLASFFMNKFIFIFLSKLVLMFKLKLGWYSINRFISDKRLEYEFQVNNVDLRKSRYKNWF